MKISIGKISTLSTVYSRTMIRFNNLKQTTNIHNISTETAFKYCRPSDTNMII